MSVIFFTAGFYGRPWSLDQRKELVGNMSKWGMNLYMYSPKVRLFDGITY